MYPPEIDYERPARLPDALQLLAERGQDARLLAGGASLVPLLKLRLASPQLLIDIGRLQGLDGVQERDGGLAIGSLTRHADLSRDPEVRSRLPLLTDVAGQIGDPQVRNMGTVGGAAAEADPAGDWGPGLLALEAEVHARSARGERTIPAGDFFVDAFTTALAPDELIDTIFVPLPAGRSGGAHTKLERRAGDYPVACASVQVRLGDDGRCERARVAIGGVALTPVRVTGAERLLEGRKPSEAELEEAARAVEASADGLSDVRGSSVYRMHVAGVLFRRAWDAAWRRATGGSVEVTDG